MKNPLCRLALAIASRAIFLAVSNRAWMATAQTEATVADHARVKDRAFPAILSITDGRYDDRHARYSPDGKRLVFTSTRGKKSHIFIMPAGGGEAKRVSPLEYSAWLPSWSPDGTHLTFESDKDGNNGIWSMPANGGDAVRLTADSITASWPDWSPDGTRIAFISNRAGNWDIYTIPVAGGKLQQITSHEDNEWNPRWSPEGKHLAFYTTWNEKMTDIWVVSADGDEPRQITNDPAEDFQPTWSPDGKWLAFFSRRGRHTNLWAVTAIGGSARLLTDDWIIYKALPDWSPDGRAITYTSFPVMHLFSVPIAGGTPSQLTEGMRFEQNPIFAPDGKHVLFSSDWFSPEEKLTLMEINSKKAQPLVREGEMPDAPMLQRTPVWSRDGRTIAFIQGGGGFLDTKNLWIVPAAGGTPKQLTRTGYVRNPVWCDEDRSLVFAAKDHIWKIAVNSDSLVQLTQEPGNYTPTDYSPAHEQVIFHQLENGTYKLFLLPVNGGKPQPFKTTLASAQNARWSPDGVQLVFASGDHGQHDLYVMPAHGGPARRVTTSEGQESLPGWSPDGKTLIYSMSFDHMKICTAIVDSL